MVAQKIFNASDAVHNVGWDVDENGCWNWRGSIGKNGYGKLRSRYPGEWFGYTAHRVVYSVYVGRIPEGLELDHTCINRGCVNPGHLEPVTQAENRRRARWDNPPEEYCGKGHPMFGYNLSHRKDGKWECRECKAIRTQRAYERKCIREGRPGIYKYA